LVGNWDLRVDHQILFFWNKNQHLVQQSLIYEMDVAKSNKDIDTYPNLFEQ
jgi:hypothetical protein